VKEIPLTQGRVAIVDDADYEMLSRFKWLYGDRYAVRRARCGVRWVTVLMHREIMQPLDGMQVDHINGDKLDNRRCNLRIVTSSQNKCNCGVQANNTSGFKGVSLSKPTGKWVANIKKHGKLHFLGYFPTAIEAARAYNRAAQEMHGEFARLNPVDEKV
jgi:hypothetical protein